MNWIEINIRRNKKKEGSLWNFESFLLWSYRKKKLHQDELHLYILILHIYNRSIL